MLGEGIGAQGRKHDDEEFNPNELRMTARFPIALFAYSSLSPGAKLLYMRLAYFRGRKANGFCAPSLEVLSEAMKVSIDTIARWEKELITEGFIVKKRRRRAAAEYLFLPHPCFCEYASTPDASGQDLLDSATTRNQETSQDSANLPNQEVQDSAEPRNQDSLDYATTRLRLRKSAVLDYANLRSPNKEENLHRKPLLRLPSIDDALSLPPTNGSNPDLERVRELLWNWNQLCHLGLRTPDGMICKKVVDAAGGNLLALELKLQDLWGKGIRPSKSYGWFVTIAEEVNRNECRKLQA